MAVNRRSAHSSIENSDCLLGPGAVDQVCDPDTALAYEVERVAAGCGGARTFGAFGAAGLLARIGVGANV